MNISACNNTQTFGKTPLFRCVVKSKESAEPVNATMYDMDGFKRDEFYEISSSKTGRILSRDYEREMNRLRPSKKFYLLKNDKSGEVIAAAETSHRYGVNENEKKSGLYTLIEILKANRKYENGEEPMYANIVKAAERSGDNNIFAAVREDEVSGLKKAKFSKTKTGDWMLPQKRFDKLIKNIEKRSQIEYNV